MSDAKGGFVQGYNCQTAVSEAGVVVAAKVTNRANDYGMLSVMLAETARNVGAGQVPEVVLADAGYFDTADLTDVQDRHPDCVLLIGTGKRGRPSTDPGPDPAAEYQRIVAEMDRQDTRLRGERAAILDKWEAGSISYRQAAQQMEVHVSRAYYIRDRWRKGGVGGIPVPKRRRPPQPADSTVMRHRLDRQMAEPHHKETYKQRSHLAETPFAHIKEGRQLKRFSRRGLDAVNAEFTFECLLHNLLRLRPHLQSP